MAVTAGPGSEWSYFVARPNGNLRISTSTMTVPIGGSVTVHASIAAPVCTYALVNSPGQHRCWDNLTFAGSRAYVPTNYSGEFTPPILSFSPYCSVEGESARANPMSCTATVLPPFGLRVLPGHYIVVVVEVEVNGPGPLDELDVDEVALKIGPAPPCMGPPGAAAEVPGGTGTARGNLAPAPLSPNLLPALAAASDLAPSITHSGSEGAGPALVPAAASPPAHCLQVYIKIVGPIPNVGTRSGLSVDNYVPDDGPMNFTKLTGSEKASPLVEAASTGQQCVSGCANILITVTNKATHKPAAKTDVNVSLGAIDTAEAPALHQQGTQFVCLQTDDFKAQDCGTSLDGLKTDENGQVRLLYWAPGEMVTAHVELSAQACTASACTLNHAQSKITVYPYRIFHFQGGKLSPETVVALVRMVESEGYFHIASQAAEKALEATAEAWVHLLAVESNAVKLALGPLGFGVAFTLIDLAHATSELLEEVGLRGAFFDATGLSEAGLYGVTDPSAFAKVLAPGDAVYFEGLVLYGGKVFSLPSGWLWELGEQLAKRYPGQFDTVTGVKPEPLDLSVYETSYCYQYTNKVLHSVGEEALCGPGYGSLHSPNIRTDLCVYISQLGKPTCGITYDAPIWVVSQEGLDKKLGHPEALDTRLP